MKRILFFVAMLVCVSESASAQLGTNQRGPIMIQTPCEILASGIAGKRAAIGILNARIANAIAECNAAEADMAAAYADAANNPLWATYYQQLGLYHFARVVYWTGEVHDNQFLLGIKQTELDALLADYALRGC